MILVLLTPESLEKSTYEYGILHSKLQSSCPKLVVHS